MATVYKEGSAWIARIRKTHFKTTKGGFATRKEAETWARNQEHAFETQGLARGFGPDRTTLGQALYDYAEKKMPFLKGAVQDLSRVNKYLRAVNLPTFKAKKFESPDETTSGTKVYFQLETVPASEVRKYAKGVKPHREKQAERSAASDKIRTKLAKMAVGSIQPFHLQELIDQMQKDGYQAATIALERALLREFFNYARRTWRWAQPALNPASDVRVPKISNERNRVLSDEEEFRIANALLTCDNPFVAPAIALLIQTCMRKSELLMTARWQDFDPSKGILFLRDAKGKPREVPLTNEAVTLIQRLPKGSGSDSLIPITMDALKSAWERARERANIPDIRLHDLRHTGATRAAIRFNGNIFLLQILTGHKTLSQLKRYVNLTASDVVAAFDATDAAKSPLISSIAGTTQSNVTEKRRKTRLDALLKKRENQLSRAPIHETLH